MRRSAGNIVANPVLVGAITLLVTVVAVFLAYNANNGLPFVPTRTVYAELENGSDVNQGVEVREGGFRIGVVDQLEPKRLSSGRVGAVVRMRLDKSAGPFPRDSRVLVRPRSPLALKIIEFERGSDRRGIVEGGRIRVEQSDINADLDQLYALYDERTREGSSRNLTGFGTAFAGRGGDLSETIRTLPRFLTSLEPVMRSLASDKADLGTFFDELGDAARIAAPVADQLASSFTHQADTFDAISRDPDALKATIEKSPPTLDDSIRSFRVQQPFLRDTAAMSRDLRAVAGDLKGALPTINGALETGTPVLRRTPIMNRELTPVLASLGSLSERPTTNGALRGLGATMNTLTPTLRYVGPFITGCNYWNIFWTFVAEHFSTPDPTGGAERVLLRSGTRQNDEVTSTGANEFVTGRGLTDPRGIRQYLHGNTTGGNAVRPDGSTDCTAGQQGYGYSANKYDDTPDKFYKRAVVDHLNELTYDKTPPKGSTFDRFDKQGRGIGQGPKKLPEGQTFTDIPEGRGEITDFERETLRQRGEARP
jgi:ABC-type transporter Mla subunit MlaD